MSPAVDAQGVRIGIDVGGTFTDGIMVKDGEVVAAKVPSQPADVAGAILECCEKLGAELSEVSLLIHGTTIATNAIIEKSGPSIAHITTAGYRDVLHIGRGDSEPYNLTWQPPTPVVRRRDIYEVPERLAWDGSVIRELDEEEARRVARIVTEKGYDAVSVVFLHSYVDPVHERRMREILEQANPGGIVCISSDVLPHYREFERSSTTAVNAYLMPLMSRYLDELQSRAREGGLDTPPLIMQSNGGVMTVAEAQRLPARTVRSGPAGGAIAAVRIADDLQLDDAILIDMGGTSTEVAVRHRGELRWTPELEFAWGVPIRFPSVEIHSIGAGGGSIAWVEGERFLKVGPHSAGADPGPACYDQGGEEATTTDAQVVLGRLNPKALLDGAMPIRRDLAERAIAERVAGPLGMELEEAALGVVRVTANNTMQAIRLMTVNRGLDPRQSTLIAYGGSGPVYAAEVARLLGMRRVVVPIYSGVTSALGMVQADFEYDHSATLVLGEDEIDYEELNRVFRELEADVDGRLAAAGVPLGERHVQAYLDIRYNGQGFELPVELPERSGGPITPELIGELKQAFHEQHEREFGWKQPSWAVELVFARVASRGVIPNKPRPGAGGRTNGTPAVTRECRFLDTDGAFTVPVIERGGIDPDNPMEGPIIIEQMDTTTVVPPGFQASLDPTGNMILEDVQRERGE